MAHSFLDVPPEFAGVPGISLFRDIFIRADKNDDGRIEFKEFREYFGDPFLSESDLKTVFESIDKDRNGTIEVGELCKYFTEGFGPFARLYGSLEQLNKDSFDALHAIAKEYPNQSKFDQFRTRFFIREIVNLLTALLKPFDAALDSLGAQAKDAPTERQPSEPIVPTRRSIIAGAEGLSSEIDRLRRYLDELHGMLHDKSGAASADSAEAAAAADTHRKGAAFSEGGEACVLVARTVTLQPGAESRFIELTREYFAESADDPGAFRFNVRVSGAPATGVLWEVWASPDDVAGHNQLSHTEAFLRALAAVSTGPVKQSMVPCAANLFRE